MLTAAAVADVGRDRGAGSAPVEFRAFRAAIPMFPRKDSGDRVAMSYEAGAASNCQSEGQRRSRPLHRSWDRIRSTTSFEGGQDRGRPHRHIRFEHRARGQGGRAESRTSAPSTCARTTLLAAKSVARSNARSGTYFASVLERLGIADQMKSKFIVVQGGPVGAAAAKGDVEIAVQQLTELMPVPGIELVGPLPPELQDRNSLFGPAFRPAPDSRTPPGRKLPSNSLRRRRLLR